MAEGEGAAGPQRRQLPPAFRQHQTGELGGTRGCGCPRWEVAIGKVLSASRPPAPGDVHVGMADRNGQLEVEVIQARGLIPKMGSKSIPGRWLGREGVGGGVLGTGAVLGPSQEPAPSQRFSPVFQRSHLREGLPVGERRLPGQEEDQGGEENL